MSEELTRLVDLKDIVVGRCLSRPIENIKNNEDLQGLSDSIDEKGQLAACIVRPMGDKYELIGGGRRYVAMLQKHTKIEVKIKNADDLESMELGIVDNVHTKSQDPRQRDSQIYKVWKFGKKHGRYEHIGDFAKKISFSEKKLKDIIYAGETAEKKEYKDSVAIKKATTNELVTTKQLSGEPKIREKVLVLEQNKDMTMKDMKDITRTIAAEIQYGTDKKLIDDALDIVLPKKQVSEEYVNNIGNTSSINNTFPTVIFEPAKFKETLNILKSSPEDVQKAVAKREISIEDAKEISQYKSEEKRTATIKEMKTVEKHKQLSARLHENDKKLILETRKKQEDDIDKNGFTRLRTESDLKLERRLKQEESYEERRNRAFLERYQKLGLDTSTVLTTYHPNKLESEKGKKDVIKVIKEIYSLYRFMLVDLGEIHKTEEAEKSRKEENIEILKIT
jgi:hypothetical protein